MKAHGLMWVLSAGLAVGAVKSSLPEWSAADKTAIEKGELVPGLLLLGQDAPAEEASAPTQAQVPQPTAEELVEKEKASPEVPEQYLEAYFGERPTSFLVDPQG